MVSTYQHKNSFIITCSFLFVPHEPIPSHLTSLSTTLRLGEMRTRNDQKICPGLANAYSAVRHHCEALNFHWKQQYFAQFWIEPFQQTSSVVDLTGLMMHK